MAIKTILSLLCVTIFFNCNSQNLVLNSGFEDYYFLQNSFQDFMKTGLTLQFENNKNKTNVKESRSFTLVEQDTFYCKNWFIPVFGSPDYYHHKNNNILFSNPLNEFGYHPSHSGYAYIGLGIIDVSGTMEYLSGKLSEPLTTGKEYEVSLYVRYTGNSSKISISRMGVRLTDKYPFKPYLVGSFYNDLITKEDKPDINWDITHVATDTGWVKLSGKYYAGGGEKYITIGLFYQPEFDSYIRRSTEKMKFLRSLPANRLNRFLKFHKKFFVLNKKYVKPVVFSNIEGDLAAFYFIDDVCVEEVKK